MKFNSVAAAGALLAGALVASPAQAQVNYYTQGYFTSATTPGWSTGTRSRGGVRISLRRDGDRRRDRAVI